MQKADVGLFNFVTGDEFRLSLESDYRELCAAMESKSWKSVHVLSGSIIEAILVDWLQANQITSFNGKPVLNVVLGDAIKACVDNNLISKQAEQLCAVVQEYRNLIHPGRLIRTQETVDQNKAEVAKALIGIISEDIARRKKESYGFTAEQIIAKVVADNATIRFLKHLLVTTNDTEKERLILTVIPNKHSEIDFFGSEKDDSAALINLEKCFRIVFDSVPDGVKKRCVGKYVSILKTGNAGERQYYEKAFFKASDVAYCTR